MGPCVPLQVPLAFFSRKAVNLPLPPSAHTERVEGQCEGGSGVSPGLEDILAQCLLKSSRNRQGCGWAAWEDCTALKGQLQDDQTTPELLSVGHMQFLKAVEQQHALFYLRGQPGTLAAGFLGTPNSPVLGSPLFFKNY